MTNATCLQIDMLEVSKPPAQKGVAFWDRQWIDPELFQLLFGGSAEHTYLVVDAHLRQSITKVFDLDTLNLPTRCLFKGDAEEQFAQSAPFLIELTLPADRVSPFHRSFFTDHWDAGTGILLRSDAPMDVIWTHLRKFIRSTSEHSPDRFFRFWETNATRDYFEAIALVPSRCKDLFELKSGHWVSMIISHANITGDTVKIAPIRAEIQNATIQSRPYRSRRRLGGTHGKRGQRQFAAFVSSL
ncbi:DUF4123 domain-containing protein [uncultured Litoreibacter sp.]|uniref:DUF4123 domain-containing protein n=1 Tax=uncultured Litoreibacter sp. TaxID=1392394 RepID=UPI00261380CA|nr:DUF4123 domain-containing protein [uncultured Litoreibacter sp.]